MDVATDGEEADVKCRSTAYDVVVLDVMLPKVDGLTLRDFELARQIGQAVAKGSTKAGSRGDQPTTSPSRKEVVQR